MEASSRSSAGDRLSAEIQKTKNRIRLYLHVQDSTQRDVASTLMETVDGRTIANQVVRAISIEKLRTGPSDTELRYFDPRQKRIAQRLVQLAHEAYSPPIEVKELSARYDTIPNHFELWLAPRPQ